MELPTPDDLKKRREALALTQSELADAAGVSQPLIARIEGGDVDPRLSTLRRIVEALDEAEGGVVRASDLMHEDIVSVAVDDSVREAERKMDAEAFSQVPVLKDGSPHGSLSHGDIVDAGENVGDLPVSEVMSESFPTVSPEDTIDKIRNYLEYNKAVVVTQGGEAVGIITEADIARYFS